MRKYLAYRKFIPRHHTTQRIILLLLFFLLSLTSPASAAKVLIIGDTRHVMVADVASEIQASLRSQSKEYTTAEVKGKLGAIVEREEAQVVVALGMDALGEALHLPPFVSVVYGLVVTPPNSGRANLTGVYMSPPVSEYTATLRRYLPALGKISVIGSSNMIKALQDRDSPQVSVHSVNSSADLVSTINRLGNARALLLLPDANLLTSQTMSNVLLYSFKMRVPLLGISETHVRQGALFALVFDHKTVSRQIAEKVQSILNGESAEELPASAPRKYHLFINSNTAQKMGIEIPEEMARKARKIY